MLKIWLQKRLVKFLTKHLFNTIGPDDVLQIRGKEVRLRGEPLDFSTIEALKADVDKFRESSLWKLLANEIKLAANQRMYEKSQSSDDILFGKAILYELEVIEKTLDEISKL